MIYGITTQKTWNLNNPSLCKERRIGPVEGEK
jgi:hypothetical protein